MKLRFRLPFLAATLLMPTLNAGTTIATFSFQQGDLQKDGSAYGSATSYAGVIDGAIIDINTTAALTATATATIGNQFQSQTTPPAANGRNYIGLFSYDLSELETFIAANTSPSSSVTVSAVSFKLVASGATTGTSNGTISLYRTDPFTTAATWSTTDGSTAWTSPFQSGIDESTLRYTGGGSALSPSLGGTSPSSGSQTAGSSLQWTTSANFVAAVNTALGLPDKKLRLMAARALGNADGRVPVNTSTATTVDNRPELVITLAVNSFSDWTGASNTSWTTAGNWTTPPGAGDNVRFNSSSIANLSTVLNANFNLNGLALTNPSGPVSIGGTNTLSLGAGGLDLSAATQNLTITAPIVLGAAQTWNVASGRVLNVNSATTGSGDLTIFGAGKTSLGVNNILPNGAGAGSLNVSGTLDLNATSQSVNALTGSGIVDNAAAGNATLTVGNNDATGTFGGTIQNTSGALALVKQGAGGLTLSGSNSFSGGTTINAGSITITNDANLGASTGGLTFNAAGGESSLFVNSSVTDSNRTVTLASTATGNIRMNAANPYTNAGKFTGAGNLRFTQTNSGFCTATLAGHNNDFSGSLTIDQNGSNNSIRVIVNSLTDPVGAGNIISKTVGTSAFPAFRLGADAAAGLTLTNRRIELAGPMGTGSFFTLSNEGVNHPFIINSDLLVSGTAGTRRLSLSGVAGPVNVFDGDIADGTDSVVSVNKTGAATWTLSGNNSHTGGTTLNGGTAGSQLNIKSATALGTGTFSITGGNNGKIDNTSGSALTLISNNAQAWDGNFTFVGTDFLNLGTGAVTMGGNRTISVTSNALTVGGIIGESAAGFGITKNGWGTLALTGANTYTGNTAIITGKLDINSIQNYGTPSGIGAPVGGDIQLGGGIGNFATLSYSGTGGSTNRTVQLGDTTPANDSVGAIQNNGTGALTFIATNFNPALTGITAARTLWLGGNFTGGTNEIQGVIQDNDAGAGGKVNVGKAIGDSIWLLSGANTYTGTTTVQAGGALKLGAAGSIANSASVTISAGGTLDTSAKAIYSTGAQPLALGIDATGSGSSGMITAAGLNVSNAVVTYNITGTPDDPVYVLATYTSLTGTFASVDAPPAGYTLNYAYEGNKIALVAGTSTPYQTWAGSALFDDDANGDGVKNGLAWILGAADKNVSALNKLPAPGTPAGYLTLSFNRVNPYAPAKLYVEYSNNLSTWTKLEIPAGSGTIPASDVEVVVTPGTPDAVQVKIPTATHASGGKLFGRLSATEN